MSTVSVVLAPLVHVRGRSMCEQSAEITSSPLLQPDTRRVILIWICSCRLVQIDSTLDPCSVTAIVIFICHLHSHVMVLLTKLWRLAPLSSPSRAHLSLTPTSSSLLLCSMPTQVPAESTPLPQWKQAWSGYPPWRWWIDGSLTGKAGGLRVNKCRAALNMKEGKENTSYLSAATESTGMRFTHAR